jgi:hypothetical protein
MLSEALHSRVLQQTIFCHLVETFTHVQCSAYDVVCITRYVNTAVVLGFFFIYWLLYAFMSLRCCIPLVLLGWGGGWW